MGYWVLCLALQAAVTVSTGLSYCQCSRSFPELSWLLAEFKVLVVVRLKFRFPGWLSAGGHQPVAALRNEDMPTVPQQRSSSRNP